MLTWTNVISFILGLVLAYLFLNCCDGQCVVIKSDTPFKKKSYCHKGNCSDSDSVPV